MTLSLDNHHWNELADSHRVWLKNFDAQYGINWENIFKADREAALCEAGVRQQLQAHGVNLRPNEQLTGKCGGPDFRCWINEECFYVEVTCISIATVESKMKFKSDANGFGPYSPFGMTDAIFSECKNKAKQCGNLDAPALVTVGTFHALGAMLGFKRVLVAAALSGKTSMSWNIDMATSQQAGDTVQTTAFRSAAFMQPSKTQGVDFVRSSISGVLLCGLGTLRGQFVGMLHPNAVRRFNPALLPDVVFGQVEVDRELRRVHVVWPE